MQCGDKEMKNFLALPWYWIVSFALCVLKDLIYEKSHHRKPCFMFYGKCHCLVYSCSNNMISLKLQVPAFQLSVYSRKCYIVFISTETLITELCHASLLKFQIQCLKIITWWQEHFQLKSCLDFIFITPRYIFKWKAMVL